MKSVTCPSCNSSTDDITAHCIRCGFALRRFGRTLLFWRTTSSWVLRRSLAGSATGLVGWMVVAAVGRAAGSDLGQGGHLIVTGVLGGIFLGTVEGMLEESSLKTLKGGLGGGLGGFIGGSVAALLLSKASPDSSAGLVALIVTWALAGGAIGIVSAWAESRLERLVAGAVAGAFGGGIGGWLGYKMYASLLDVAKIDHWFNKRLVEGMTGAILGALLWVSIGLAEKLFIFKRRLAKAKDYKSCDRCRKLNPLFAWYCADCGAVLQEAAAPERLVLPKWQGLERLVSGLQFLGRLAGTTSAIVMLPAALFLGGINVFLGVFGLLATALLGYFAGVLFRAAADWLESSAE